MYKHTTDTHGHSRAHTHTHTHTHTPTSHTQVEDTVYHILDLCVGVEESSGPQCAGDGRNLPQSGKETDDDDVRVLRVRVIPEHMPV